MLSVSFCLYLTMIFILGTTEYSQKSSDFSPISRSSGEGPFAYCWEKNEFWQSMNGSLFKYLGPRKMRISWGGFWLTWRLASCTGGEISNILAWRWWWLSWVHEDGLGALLSSVPPTLARPLPIVPWMFHLELPLHQGSLMPFPAVLCPCFICLHPLSVWFSGSIRWHHSCFP